MTTEISRRRVLREELEGDEPMNPDTQGLELIAVDTRNGEAGETAP